MALAGYHAKKGMKARLCFGLTRGGGWSRARPKRNMLFFVPLRVRFLAMTMFKQALHCLFGLTKTLVPLAHEVGCIRPKDKK
jgi:hypothetical protein